MEQVFCRRVLSTMVLLFFLGSVFSQNNKVFIVNPCQGMDKLVINESTEEAMDLFEGIVFEKEQNVYLACGNDMSKYSQLVTYYNDSLGLKFCFSSESYELDNLPESVLSKIEISKPCVRFANGIMVGKSAMDDVILAFGNNGTIDKYIIKYDDMGLLFIFDEENILVRIVITECKNK